MTNRNDTYDKHAKPTWCVLDNRPKNRCAKVDLGDIMAREDETR